MNNVLVKKVVGVDWISEGEIFEWFPNMDVIIDSDGLAVHYGDFDMWQLNHWTITDDKILTLVGKKSGNYAQLEVIE